MLAAARASLSPRRPESRSRIVRHHPDIPYDRANRTSARCCATDRRRGDVRRLGGSMVAASTCRTGLAILWAGCACLTATAQDLDEPSPLLRHAHNVAFPA